MKKVKPVHHPLKPITTRCWLCDAVISDNPFNELKRGGHDCNHGLKGFALDVAMALWTAESSCDHYCCGMTPKECRAKLVAETLSDRLCERLIPALHRAVEISYEELIKGSK